MFECIFLLGTVLCILFWEALQLINYFWKIWVVLKKDLLNGTNRLPQPTTGDWWMDAGGCFEGSWGERIVVGDAVVGCAAVVVAGL